MTDELTTDELVKLAESCGHETNTNGHDVWLGGYHEHCRWRPDLDANQRDGVVEAMFYDDLYLSVETVATDDREIAFWVKVLNLTGDEVAQLISPTPGDAVCRAALNALEKHNEDNS